MNRNVLLTSLAALSLAAAASPAPAAGPGQGISIARANDILELYLRDRGQTRLRGFGLDRYENADAPGFYFFTALFDNREGSAVLGNYAVDRRTGDIWSATHCHEEISPSASALQRRLRARMRMNAAAYRRLRRPGPLC